MIEGITVLAQKTITPPTGDIVAAFIFAALFLILGIMAIVVCISTDEPILCVTGALCLLGACILGTIGFTTLAEKPYVEYKVLIDQNVSWSEVYENYEIIDQEGQIYTIKDKEK